jgi:hypothetical protein
LITSGSIVIVVSISWTFGAISSRAKRATAKEGRGTAQPCLKQDKHQHVRRRGMRAWRNSFYAPASLIAASSSERSVTGPVERVRPHCMRQATLAGIPLLPRGLDTADIAARQAIVTVVILSKENPPQWKWDGKKRCCVQESGGGEGRVNLDFHFPKIGLLLFPKLTPTTALFS